MTPSQAATRASTGQSPAERETTSSAADVVVVSARERLLRAATELFYSNGISASGIDSIIARANVAKMSLYNNFQNKDELIAEVLRRRDQKWFESLSTFVDAHAKLPSEKILAVFDFLSEQFADPHFRGCPFQMAAAELPDGAHPGRKAILAHKHRLRQYLQRLCREAGVPEKMADQFTLLADGASAWRGMTGSNEPAKRAREAAESLLSLVK
jgi:AcrR family transcriptional regulator